MIHWHGLYWKTDRDPHILLYNATHEGFLGDECAQILSDWATKNFQMTANHPAGQDENGNPKKQYWPPPDGTAPARPENANPLLKLLMDASTSQETLLEDHLLLTNRINLHRCSDYCLRLHSNKHSSSEK